MNKKIEEERRKIGNKIIQQFQDLDIIVTAHIMQDVLIRKMLIAYYANKKSPGKLDIRNYLLISRLWNLQDDFHNLFDIYDDFNANKDSEEFLSKCISEGISYVRDIEATEYFNLSPYVDETKDYLIGIEDDDVIEESIEHYKKLNKTCKEYLLEEFGQTTNLCTVESKTAKKEREKKEKYLAIINKVKDTDPRFKDFDFLLEHEYTSFLPISFYKALKIIFKNKEYNHKTLTRQIMTYINFIPLKNDIEEHFRMLTKIYNQSLMPKKRIHFEFEVEG